MQTTHKFPKTGLLLVGSVTLVLASTSAVAALNLGGIGSIVNGVEKVTGLTAPILDKAGVDSTPLEEVNNAVGTFNQTVGEVNYHLSQLRSFYSAIVGGNLWGILDGIDSVIGVLGIPDPDATAIVLNKEPFESIELNKQAKAAQVQIVHGITASVLGKSGQARLGAVMQQADHLTQQAAAYSEAAQTKNITQEVLKEMAKTQAAGALLERIQSAQLLDLQIGQAGTNLALSDISGAIEQINHAREIEQISQAALMQSEGHSVIIPSLKIGQPPDYTNWKK